MKNRMQLIDLVSKENFPSWVDFLVNVPTTLAPWERRDFELIPAPNADLDALKKRCEDAVRGMLFGCRGSRKYYDVMVRERNGHILIAVQNPL